MEPIITAAIVGALGLVLVAVVTAIGTIILKRMTVLAEAQAAAIVVAATAKAAAEARDLKINTIGDTVEIIRVEVDGKLKEILELNRDLRYAQGKDAGRLEEVANAQAVLAQNQTAPVTVSTEALAAAMPDALAAVMPQVLPTVLPQVLATVIPQILPQILPQLLPDLIGKVVESKVVAVKDDPDEPPGDAPR